ncbi:putative membrane protein [Anaplasma phagocytophilum str. NCH-1]|uniref:Putative membrane protein n=1 Tax=Anaplasma phagocytophilum str. NCH-1 TaxID=1359161 RepID=A0A0F3N666_ANAPH|nr:putative membrane protein [Anaplasma phagocytophilum str. NCH-1]KJV86876.1 putative membrane protein [Anaplasma phagocytophilum str. ApNYW]
MKFCSATLRLSLGIFISSVTAVSLLLFTGLCTEHHNILVH